MPYSTISEVPSYVPKDKRKQWLEVFNSAYAAAKKDGKSNKEAEQAAFAQANSVAGPNSEKAMKRTFSKFIPFIKVDNSIDPTTGQPRREVWGVVTAELPDKEKEVCDYEKSLPYYRAVIEEMTKATGGKNIMPLREMHQLKAAGKGIGFEPRDETKEIFMGFKVVDDDAWKKVDEGVYTGFSQGGNMVGEMIPDPVFKGCMRYVANPAEISLVDNPCLGAAHFAYIKADGSCEMRKLRSTPINKGERPMGKTKTINNVELGREAFAYVGDPDKPETWRIPIDTPAGVRKAIIEWDRVSKLGKRGADSVCSPNEQASTYARILLAAKQFNIDDSVEKARFNQIVTHVRKTSRVYVNKHFRRLESPSLQKVDTDLGRLHKGMCEVSQLAYVLEELSYLFYCVANEQEWEDDKDSKLPSMLSDNIDSVIESLLEMVDEETRELKELIDSRVS